MRILLRKVDGVFGALIGNSSGALVGPAPAPQLSAVAGGFTRLLLPLLIVLAALVALLSALVTPTAAVAVAAAPSMQSPDVLVGLAGVAIMGTLDPFETNTMLGVVQNLKRPNTGLLSAFFPTISQSQTESISFDIDEGKRYLAPFVSPLAEAPVKEARGQKVATFNPAYVKEKARFTPDRALRRMAGESFGGSLSPEQRRDLALSSELADQAERIMRRKEAMAFEALFSGKVTVVGDKYPQAIVDFGRDSTLNAAANDLTGTARWSTATGLPMDNLDDLSENTVKLSGSALLDIVMDADAWRAFRANKNVQRDLELPKYDAGTIMSLEPVTEGLQYKGQYGGYRIWLYTGFYTATNGTETDTMSGGYIMGIGALDGVQHQGAIQDEEAGMQPLEIYPKSWVTPDPSVRWIMSQSAPLVVPRRVNATAVMKVLNAS